MSRAFWFLVGCLSLLCGLIGAVLPLLPTTPFLLLAAYAFSKSSARLHGWIVNHPRFGPPVRDWQTEGAISRKAKLMAVGVMILTWTISAAVGIGSTVLLIQGAVLACSAGFILTRPTPKHRS